MQRWDLAVPGVLLLPSGRRVRGRGLHRPPPPGPAPQLGRCLLATRPDERPWPSRWVRWPDFRTPSDRADALDAACGIRAREQLRRNCHPKAVETFWQRRYVRCFTADVT